MRNILPVVVLGAAVGLAADVNHGVQLYEQGKYKDAENELSQVVKAEERNGRAWRYLGLARIEERKLSEAQDALNHAQEIEPGGETNAALARLYVEQKDYDKAESALSHASGEEVSYVRGLANLGRGRNEDAAKDLELFLQNKPDHAYAHYYAGMAYNGMKRPDKMLTHFELFVKMKPDAPEARKVRAVLQTGR